jgi:uncharacterized protein YecE (DUF72 family)
MRFFVGTSGYSYKEWKGIFYPQKLPQKEMLRYYAERFSTVELNNTFYRMPKESVVESWASEVPETFRFALKASQIITHRKRLQGVENETEHLLRAASVLGERLGPLLFQLPPNMKKNLARLEAFLALVAGRTLAAFEFRHESWFDEEVFACLKAQSCPLCLADTDEGPVPDLSNTAPWGYVRLRREEYTDETLREWVAKIRSQGWNEAYVFFKHEDTGTGPKFASRFLELAGQPAAL